MAKSRKDSRGYVLRTGESQRKDGRYSYSYTDLDKNRRTVYAKTLVELRAKERKIIRDKEDGLNPQLADRMTLNELYDRFIEQKYDLKPSTKVNYLYMYNHFVRPTFGKRLIGKIKYSDVKKFYYRIILDEEMKANTLSSNYIYYEDDGKYNVVVALTKEYDNIEKIEGVYNKKLKLRRYLLNNNEIISKLDEYDRKLKETTSSEEIRNIIIDMINIYKDKEDIKMAKIS